MGSSLPVAYRIDSTDRITTVSDGWISFANLFLGLALLFAAQVFDDDGPERGARRGLVISGLLCVAGIVGRQSEISDFN